MRSARKSLEIMVTLISVVALVGMTLLVTADALTRGFLDEPISRALPLVQYWFMPGVVFVGYLLAQASDRHLRADLVFSRFPAVAQAFYGACGWLASAALAFSMSWFSFEYARQTKEVERADAITGLSTWEPTFLVPVATAALGLLFLAAAGRSVRRSPGPAQDLHQQFEKRLEGSW